MTASLAELLRDLKERSGLSYGVLAGRLHMSTSTVHRCCNGAAVPAEFAVVERFARLCGATPEELVEAHRRWVLADEGRGRARGPEGERARRPSPASSISLTSPAESAAPPATTTPGAPASAPPTPPGPATTTSSLFPARRRHACLLALSVAAVVAAGSVALGVSGGTDGDPHRQLAGPMPPPALSAAPAPRPGEHGAEDGPGESARPKRTHGTDGAGSPDAPHTAGGQRTPAARTPSGARPSAGARTGPGVPHGGGEGPASVGRGAEPPGLALTARTRPYADEYEDDCAQSFLVDRETADVPMPPARQDIPAWVGELGAVPAGGQYVQVTVQGLGKAPVVLEDMAVRVHGTGAPPAWNVFHLATNCGETVETKAFSVDLDAAAPRLAPIAGQRGFPYRISESDPLVFYVDARAERLDVRWHLDLRWSSGDRRGTLRIDDQGKPFRTSGTRGRPSYHWSGADRWEPGPRPEGPGL
ncbi:helix-turn-helix domain-containing protein [Streptomyces sp. NPDC002564]|uniref:helix-turn-helix domain-containing protein n=1 Tax=Streptomyces sp. NPDC002564 TaxID=3364649 RepID=UPI00367DD04E